MRPGGPCFSLPPPPFPLPPFFLSSVVLPGPAHPFCFCPLPSAAPLPLPSTSTFCLLPPPPPIPLSSNPRSPLRSTPLPDARCSPPRPRSPAAFAYFRASSLNNKLNSSVSKSSTDVIESLNGSENHESRQQRLASRNDCGSTSLDNRWKGHERYLGAAARRKC